MSTSLSPEPDSPPENRNAATAKPRPQPKRANAPAGPSRRRPKRHEGGADGDADLHRERRDQIDAEGIVQPLAGEDRVLGPEGPPFARYCDVGPVQRQVAVVVGQEREERPVSLVGEPEELAEAGGGKATQGHPVPGSRPALQSDRSARSTRRDRDDDAGPQGKDADPRRERSGEDREQRSHEPGARPTHEESGRDPHRFSTAGFTLFTRDPHREPGSSTAFARPGPRCPQLLRKYARPSPQEIHSVSTASA